MKRVYKNNDIRFNLAINKVMYEASIVSEIEFKFYTLNKANNIIKTKADIKNNQIVIEWKDLSKLEQGVLYYDYKVSVDDPELVDKKFDTITSTATDYYLMTGKTGVNLDTDVIEWGNIAGDINKQSDLTELVDNKYTELDQKLNKNTEDLNNTIAKNTEDLNNTINKNELVTSSAITEINKSLEDTQTSLGGSLNELNSRLTSDINDLTIYANNQDKELATTFNKKLTLKQDNLSSGVNIKTVNGKSILGSGDLKVISSRKINDISDLYN